MHSLDIQSNKIDGDAEDVAKLLDVLAKCPELRVVYLKGNDIIKKIKHYRKTMISRCEKVSERSER